MDLTGRGAWSEKLNNFTVRAGMPLMAAAILFHSTSFDGLAGNPAVTLQNILAIVIIAAAFCNAVSGGKAGFCRRLRANGIMLLYFAVRAVSVIAGGFPYAAIRSVFFEAFYLFGITSTAIDGVPDRSPAGNPGGKRGFDFYVSLFLIFEIAFSGLCAAIYFAAPYLSRGSAAFLQKYTLYGKYPASALFVNPNTAGIMSAFALILLWGMFIKESRRGYKGVYTALIAFQLYFLYLQGCRSAEAALMAAAAAAVLVKFIKKTGKKAVVMTVLSLCIAFTGAVYAAAGYSAAAHPLSLDETETKINSISSNRYAIWKGCVIEQREHPLLGAGSLSIEQRNRKRIFQDPDAGYSYHIQAGADFGPHSGYIAMVSTAGWLGSVFFTAALYLRIKRSGAFAVGSRYLLAVFALVVNLFESLFILNRFFLCFYFFLILEGREGNVKRKDIYSDHNTEGVK